MFRGFVITYKGFQIFGDAKLLEHAQSFVVHPDGAGLIVNIGLLVDRQNTVSEAAHKPPQA